ERGRTRAGSRARAGPDQGARAGRRAPAHADAGQRTRDAPGPAGSPAAPRHDAGTRARSAARRGARETARAGTDASAPGEAVSADAVSVSSRRASPMTG